MFLCHDTGCYVCSGRTKTEYSLHSFGLTVSRHDEFYICAYRILVTLGSQAFAKVECIEGLTMGTLSLRYSTALSSQVERTPASAYALVGGNVTLG